MESILFIKMVNWCEGKVEGLIKFFFSAKKPDIVFETSVGWATVLLAYDGPVLDVLCCLVFFFLAPSVFGGLDNPCKGVWSESLIWTICNLQKYIYNKR